jgi:preprotein translocase subunit SecF
MIGVIVGTYSSVCIATPILIDFSRKSKDGLKEKEIEKVSVAEA